MWADRRFCQISGIVAVFCCSSDAYAGGAFGTYFSDDGTVIELSRLSEGAISGAAVRMDTDGNLASDMPIEGYNQRQGELKLTFGSKGEDKETLTYLRRVVPEVSAFGKEIYTEWYAPDWPKSSGAPESFRSVIQGDSEAATEILAASPAIESLTFGDLSKAESALDDYFERAHPGVALPVSPLHRGNYIALLTDRAGSAWLEGATQAVGFDASGPKPTFSQTYGKNETLVLLDRSYAELAVNVALTQEKLNPSATRYRVIPQLFYQFEVPSPNIMTKFVETSSVPLLNDEMKKIMNEMSLEYCAPGLPKDGDITIGCDYYSDDFKIDGPYWFNTSAYLSLRTSHTEQTSRIAVFTRTYSANVDRDRYDVAQKTWGNIAKEEDVQKAEAFFRTRLEAAFLDLYAR